jgi:hypothetical protein
MVYLLHSKFNLSWGFLWLSIILQVPKTSKDSKSGYLWGNKFTWNQNHFWKTPKELFSTKVVECKLLKEWFVRFCTKTWHWKNILIVLEWKSLIALRLVNTLEFENIMNRSFAVTSFTFKKGTIFHDHYVLCMFIFSFKRWCLITMGLTTLDIYDI